MIDKHNNVTEYIRINWPVGLTTLDADSEKMFRKVMDLKAYFKITLKDLIKEYNLDSSIRADIDERLKDIENFIKKYSNDELNMTQTASDYIVQNLHYIIKLLKPIDRVYKKL